MKNDPTLIGRRGLMLGGAGLLISACSSSDPKGDKPNASGPVIARPETGNVVSAEDAAVVARRFNEAFEAGDLGALMQAGGPGVEDLFEFEARWKRRLKAFDRLGFVEGEWFVGPPQRGRTRNTSGGPVEFSSALVFAHRVAQCDARQVVESYAADFRKKSTDAPLRLLSIGEVEEFFDPSIWDLAEVDAITTKHAYIVFRPEEADRATRHADLIESGAGRAFDLMPAPDGVSKVFYGLTWPAVEKKLWGGRGNAETSGNAYVHRFLEPDQVAKGQTEPAGGTGQPLATGRVGLHGAAFSSTTDFVEEVACHEAVHVLADQWNSENTSAPFWVTEGLAEWAGLRPGSDRLMNRYGGAIRTGFSHFTSIAAGDYDAFHDTAHESDNYACAAAVFAYIDETMGRDEVFAVAKAFYLDSTDQDVVNSYGESGAKLVAATQKWLDR